MAQAQRRGAGGQGLGQNLWDLIGPAKMVGLYLRTSSTSDCKYTTFYTSPTTLKWDEANSL